MKKIILIAALALVFAGGMQAAKAHAAINLTGWAWSSNIGWLSFNSSNANSGGGNYRVSIATSTAQPTLGSFSGYAWSSNIGWVSFNSSDVSGCPSSESTNDSPTQGAPIPTTGNSASPTNCAPRLDFTTGKVSGWARVLSIAAEDNTSGWMHLSGTNHQTGSGGVTYNPSTGALSGYAYEPSAIGWVSFNATAPIPGVVVCTVGVNCPGSVSPTCSIGAITISGDDVLIPVTIPSGGTFYSLNRDGSEVDRTKNTPETIVDAGLALQPGTYTYQLVRSSNGVACGNPAVFTIGQTSLSTGLKLMIATPSTSLSSTDYNDSVDTYKALRLVVGNQFKLQWNVDPAAGYDMCIPYTSGAIASFGSGSDSGTQTYPTSGVAAGTYTFAMTCSTGGLNPKTSSVKLNLVSSSVEEI